MVHLTAILLVPSDVEALAGFGQAVARVVYNQ